MLGGKRICYYLLVTRRQQPQIETQGRENTDGSELGKKAQHHTEMIKGELIKE
jgi:hypothetical protein